jgi:hypothetical protein
LILKKDYAKSIRQSQLKILRASVSLRVRLGSLALPPCDGGGNPRSTADRAPSRLPLPHRHHRAWLGKALAGAGGGEASSPPALRRHRAVALTMGWRKASWWRPCGGLAASAKVGRRRSLQQDGGICIVVWLGGAEKGREGRRDGRRRRRGLPSRRRRCISLACFVGLIWG